MEVTMPAAKFVRYYIDNIRYEFGTRSLREESFLYKMRENGISLVDINLELDNMNFPLPSNFRLPEVFEGRPILIDIINSTLDKYSKNRRIRSLAPEKKARMLARKVSRNLQKDLAYDPRLFLQIMVPRPRD